MNTIPGQQQLAADGSGIKCQVDGKTGSPVKRERVRSGMGTAAYWKARLFRNSYRDREGRTVEIPEWYARMRHAGITKKVRLTYSEKDKAADHALSLFLRLEKEGWSVINERQARLPRSESIEEFCELYRNATQSMEKAPRKITIALYTRSLRQLCSLAGAKTIRELTPSAIEKARDLYRAKARADGRQDSAIQNSLSKVLRAASGCFSTEARAIMKRLGVDVESPFAGMSLRQDIQPVTPLDASIVKKVWDGLAKLRDGDPNAHIPAMVKFRREYRAKHGGRKARWLPSDFTKPNPNAAAAVLLALGAGLRRNEVDKARWSWLRFDGEGRCFLDVRQETDFVPKGGSNRLIKIPRELHDAVVRCRVDLSSPYVLGGIESPQKTKHGEGYRRPEVFRIASQWLAAQGVGSRTPLHQLRKQFGSFVATEFGLFAAQKLLGHKSPDITAKYYAGLTELPDLTHVRVVG